MLVRAIPNMYDLIDIKSVQKCLRRICSENGIAVDDVGTSPPSDSASMALWLNPYILVIRAKADSYEKMVQKGGGVGYIEEFEKLGWSVFDGSNGWRYLM